MRCCETVAAVETTARRPTERARLESDWRTEAVVVQPRWVRMDPHLPPLEGGLHQEAAGEVEERAV